jgi:hypothetical protein
VDGMTKQPVFSPNPSVRTVSPAVIAAEERRWRCLWGKCHVEVGHLSPSLHRSHPVFQRAAIAYVAVGAALNLAGTVYCVLSAHYSYLSTFVFQLVVYSLAVLAPVVRRPGLYYPFLITQVCSLPQVCSV